MDQPGGTLYLRLPAEPAAAKLARDAIRDFASHLEPEVQFDLALMVNELVINSVRHGCDADRPLIELLAELGPAGLWVEVADSGDGFEPVVAEPSEVKQAGWGLFLVDKLADRWGLGDGPGARVWFEADLPLGDRPGATR